MIAWGVSVFIGGALAIEAVLAARHERRQRERGGIEPPDDVYRVMRVAYPGAFVLMIVEGLVRGGPASLATWSGVVMLALAKALKWWAIVTLGVQWTFRVIVVPGDPRITRGPYRLVAHPNYVAVVGELLGVALAMRAWMTGPLALAGFSILLWRRVRVERRMVDAILQPR